MTPPRNSRFYGKAPPGDASAGVFVFATRSEEIARKLFFSVQMKILHIGIASDTGIDLSIWERLLRVSGDDLTLPIILRSCLWGNDLSHNNNVTNIFVCVSLEQHRATSIPLRGSINASDTGHDIQM